MVMVLFAIMSMYSCHDPNEQELADPELKAVTDGDIEVGCEGGECVFEYELLNPTETETVSVTVSEDTGWVTDVDAETSGQVHFTVLPNEDTVGRETELTIHYGKASLSFGVVQYGEEYVPSPEFSLGQSEMDIPAEGGEAKVNYTVVNPAEDGTVSAVSVSEWISGITCGSASEVVFHVDANTLEEPRTAELEVKYTYVRDDVEYSIADTLTITQEASVPSYDYDFAAEEFTGYYYGTYFSMGDEHNYVTWLSDIGFDEEGYMLPGGTYYGFDLYAASPEDDEHPLPPAGVYTLGLYGETAEMTFSPGDSYARTVSEDGYSTLMDVTFEEGTLVLEYVDEGVSIEAEILDNEGKTHHVSYTGPISYSVEAHTGDEAYPTIYSDLEVEATYASAMYVEDYDQKTMRVQFDITDMQVFYGMMMPPGTQIILDACMPYDEDGKVAAGTYRISESMEDYTLYPGGEWGGLVFSGSRAVNYEDYSFVYHGLFVDGEMEITEDAAGYSITYDFVTAQGYRITGSYSGELAVEGMPGPGTTLDGDYTLNTEGCTGEAYYYGNGYYGTDGGYWEISVLPAEGSGADGFMIQLVSPSLDFTQGIIGGVYTPAAVSSYVQPNEYVPGSVYAGEISGTAYVGGFTEDGYVTEFAPAVDGDLTVSSSGDGNYTFSFSFSDGYGNVWSGEWTGHMELYNGLEGYSAQKRNVFGARKNVTGEDRSIKVGEFSGEVPESRKTGR